MDTFEKFMNWWNPKLNRWDSFIEELHEAEFASRDEANDVEENKQAVDSQAQRLSGSRGTSLEKDSQQSLSDSGSDDSNANSGSESEEDDIEGCNKHAETVNEVKKHVGGTSGEALSKEKGVHEANQNKKGATKEAVKAREAGMVLESKKGMPSTAASAGQAKDDSIQKIIPSSTEGKQVSTSITNFFHYYMSVFHTYFEDACP
jgi:hypothetical protein